MVSLILGSDRAEDLDAKQLVELFASIESDEAIVRALQSPGVHLLEGSRGTGKTTLLRVAAERLRSGTGTRVPIFLSFAKYLATYNPTARSKKGYHPFQNWVLAKIIRGILGHARRHDTAGLLSGGVPIDTYIERLETHHQDGEVSDPQKNAAALGIPERNILDFARLDQIQSRMLSLLDKLKLREVVLFLDEAAQSFAEDLQPEFFSLLKHLRHARIAVKVATYPHITNYGPDFDIGHDAIVLRIEREVEQEESMAFFEDFLEKRFGGTKLGKGLHAVPVTRKLLIKASGGNPRWVIHLLSAIGQQEERINANTAMAAIKQFPDSTLWPYLSALRGRLRAKRRHVEAALQLAQVFIEDLQEINRGRSAKKSPVCYVAVSLHKSLPYRVHAALRLLQYAGIIYSRGPKRITARENAEMFLLHPAIQIKENTLFGEGVNASATSIVEAFTSPSTRQFRSYTKNSPRLLEMSEELEEQLVCRSCNADLSMDAKFCSRCGTPVEHDSLYLELRELSSSELELTPGVRRRLVEDGRFPSVGAVLDADVADLEQVYMIGPTRSRVILYAAEELVAG